MIDLAIISGSGFYDFPALEKPEKVKISTSFGDVVLEKGIVRGKTVVFLARHGKDHAILPHKINYRANMMALSEMEVKSLIMTSVCGVLDKSIPLTKIIVFDDLYYPNNRLPDGEICCIYEKEGDKNRGHYIFDKPFSEDLREQILDATENPLSSGVYAHASGPRFNSKSEIKMFQGHADFISQTAGPEIILAGELEIPCALVGYGVDYANGVTEVPTPIDVLSKNLKESKAVFTELLLKVIDKYQTPRFTGINYRF